MATDSTKTLAALREQRKTLDKRSIEIESLPVSDITEKHLTEIETLRQDMQSLQIEIAQAHLREMRTAPIIAPTESAGRAQHAVDKFADWARGGFREQRDYNMGLETRALALSNFGTAGQVNVPDFTRYFERDSKVFMLANTVTVGDGATRNIWRQTAQGSAAVSAEAAAFNTLENTAAVVQITPAKSTATTTVSKEALNDMAWNVEGEIVAQHAEAHAAYWESQFLRDASDTDPANGVNGLLDDTANVKFANEYNTTGTNNTTLTLTALAQVVFGSGLNTSYLSDAVWLMGPSIYANTIAQAGTTLFGGTNGPVLGVNGPENRLLGFPVYLSSQFPGSADAEPIAIFGSIKRGYRIHVVNGVDFVADPYSLAANGQVKFSSSLRVGGAIMDRNACVRVLS